MDAERAGTARTASGATLVVGSTDSAPADPIGSAAAGCLMQAFLDVASEAGVPVLGYMATADVDTATERPVIRLHSYVVVPAEVTEREVARLGHAALARSPMARLLGDRCIADWSLRAVHGGSSKVGK